MQNFSGAKEYAALYRGSTPVADFFCERLTHVCETLRLLPGGRLLDIGCGPGILLHRVADSEFELFGVDLSAPMIAEAAASAVGRQVNLTVARIEQLPYGNGAFDVVLALGVLEYVQDIEAALQEIARVAKPNATIIISMLNRRSAYWLWRMHVINATLRRMPFIGAGRRRCHDDLNIYDCQRISAVLMQQGIKPNATVYYGLNLGLEPLSTRYPRLVSNLNRLCDRVAGRHMPSILCTAFLLCGTYLPGT